MRKYTVKRINPEPLGVVAALYCGPIDSVNRVSSWRPLDKGNVQYQTNDIMWGSSFGGVVEGVLIKNGDNTIAMPFHRSELITEGMQFSVNIPEKVIPHVVAA